MKKTKHLIFILFTLFNFNLSGQTALPSCELSFGPSYVSNSQTFIPSGWGLGQTFQAENDVIDGIRIASSSHAEQTMVLNLYEGTYVPGNNLSTYSIIASSSPLVPATSTKTNIYFNFDSQVPLSVGSDYFFLVFPSVSFSPARSNPGTFDGGVEAFTSTGTNMLNRNSEDMEFEVYNCLPPESAPLPTMSQWALVIVSICLLMLGIFGMRRLGMVNQ